MELNAIRHEIRPGTNVLVLTTVGLQLTYLLSISHEVLVDACRSALLHLRHANLSEYTSIDAAESTFIVFRQDDDRMTHRSVSSEYFRFK